MINKLLEELKMKNSEDKEAPTQPPKLKNGQDLFGLTSYPQMEITETLPIVPIGNATQEKQSVH